MTHEQIAKRIETMPLGPFAMLMGFVEDGAHVNELIEARKMMVESLRKSQEFAKLPDELPTEL
jgi:hypothetical protein